MNIMKCAPAPSCGASRWRVDALSRPCRATLPRRALNLGHKYFPRSAVKVTKRRCEEMPVGRAYLPDMGGTKAKVRIQWPDIGQVCPTYIRCFTSSRPSMPRALIPNPSPGGRREKTALSLRGHASGTSRGGVAPSNSPSRGMIPLHPRF
jgi:hypothetical protein